MQAIENGSEESSWGGAAGGWGEFENRVIGQWFPTDPVIIVSRREVWFH
jgi:hypothetical protein